MKRILPLVPLLVVLALIGLILKKPEVNGNSTSTNQGSPEKNVTDYKVEEFVTGLEVPWSIVFTSPERMLVSERPGRIRVIEKGKLFEKPLYVFNDVWVKEEAGLMGMTADPDYQNNKFLYASYVYSKGGLPFVKVVRLVDEGGSARLDKVLIDNIKANQFHDGSRIKFGPDGKLYITTGEAAQKELAQKLDSPNGKILRLNNDGSIPADNPFGPKSPVFSYGHRNPQGIAWQKDTNNLWQTEHGPSGFDGSGGGDEINIIKKGGNFGWPLVSHEKTRAGTVAPKLIFTPAIAPAGATFYYGNRLPMFKGNFFFATLRGEGIYRVVVSETDLQKIDSFEKLAKVNLGRIRDIIEGPDGLLYFSTSNRDGRGRARSGDDKIMRIVPL